MGKHKKVPPEEKLLRLYSCLEGEALLTIQNLGYSAASYDVAVARLIRKYGGKRRELIMRLEELVWEMQMILNDLQSYWIHLW